MNVKIDIKSALLGLALGIAATVAVAATTSSGSVGRYQIAGTANHGLVLDTITGQVWSAFFLPNEGKTDPDYFQPKLSEKK
jgi:hypothetical protein